MTKVHVSVIIPAYNARQTIQGAIESALNQTLPPFEIIVVDDGSKDDTADIVAAMAPRVTLVRQANQGCGQARNTGARSARGDWLAFLDADDSWLPQKLERQAPYTEDPNVAVVTCRARNKAGQPMPQQISFDMLWKKNELIVSSSLVRRGVFEAEGGFWAGRACEDYHMWLRLTGSGWLLANCPEDLVIYSPAPGSLSQQTESFAAAEMACINDIAARFAIPESRLRARLFELYLFHARGAINVRNMKLAKRLARNSFTFGFSKQQIQMFIIANLPVSILDLRRALIQTWKKTDHPSV